MIKDNLLNIKKSIPQDVLLVAVSKTKPIEAIQEAYETGHRNFGENKVQEAVDKWTEIKNNFQNLKLHMIGKLQTFKVIKWFFTVITRIHGLAGNRSKFTNLFSVC